MTGFWAGYAVYHASTPVRIGVLLPVTGDIELREPLEWAKDTINSQGGIGGRQVELVYRDTGSGNTLALARELLADDSIRIVIGPPASDDVYTLAPEFADKKKILISPLATSGDIVRAFGKTGYFWRTTQGDVGQVKVIISLLSQKGAHQIALLAENSTYGDTFYDWTGFYAIETGMDVGDIRRFEPGSSDLEADVAKILKSNPDYLIAACSPTDAARIKREIDLSGSTTRLFLTDAAESPALIRSLGTAAEGLEGTSPTADPSSGFSTTYKEKFGYEPADFAAPAYDALLLATYISARQDGSMFESPADSARHVVYGNGTAAGWDEEGSRTAIAAIRVGGSPDIAGASGTLDYDKEFGVDPLVAYYAHWIVENQTFRTAEVLDSDKSGTAGAPGESAGRTRSSSSYMQALPDNTGKYVPPEERKELRAVIVGPSRGWSNYRHQADALTLYAMLRENGVPDDHIILMVYDDIPTLPENPLTGDIHHQPKGKNLRSGAMVDYEGREVTSATLKNVLTGNKTDTSPVVLESTSATNVLVYIVSHGDQGEIIFSGNNAPFTSADFVEVTDSMNRNGQYRQMVFMVDTCFGESIAVNATAPGVLFFTGASRSEPSLGAVYDPDIQQWLSDEFTTTVVDLIVAEPDISLRKLYIRSYEQVTGSHVRMLNAENFGDLSISVREFLTP